MEDEFQKLKKENYIEKEKEIKMKAIEKFKNNYESKIKKEARNFDKKNNSFWMLTRFL